MFGSLAEVSYIYILFVSIDVLEALQNVFHVIQWRRFGVFLQSVMMLERSHPVGDPSLSQNFLSPLTFKVPKFRSFMIFVVAFELLLMFLMCFVCLGKG